MAAAAAAAAATTTTTTDPSHGSHSGVSPAAPLASLTVPAPSGFTSESTDAIGGGPTGVIPKYEAFSADCNPGASPVQAGWKGSVLRYFDNQANGVTQYILLCVTQLDSSALASVNETEVVALPEKSEFGTWKCGAYAAVNNAYECTTTSTTKISYSIGPYFAFIVGTSAKVDQSNLSATPYDEGAFTRLLSKVAVEQSGRL
jgi:hypothetical protein